MMGKVRHMLAEKSIDKKSEIYSSNFSIELCETFHVHLRNLRLTFDTEEFTQICESFKKAFVNWEKMDFKRAEENAPDDPIIGLAGGTIKAEAGSINKYICPSNLSVDLQEYNDYIHLKYRGLRIDLTIAEFVAFSEVIKEAANKIQEKHSDEIGTCEFHVND